MRGQLRSNGSELSLATQKRLSADAQVIEIRKEGEIVAPNRQPIGRVIGLCQLQISLNNLRDDEDDEDEEASPVEAEVESEEESTITFLRSEATMTTTSIVEGHLLAHLMKMR